MQNESVRHLFLLVPRDVISGSTNPFFACDTISHTIIPVVYTIKSATMPSHFVFGVANAPCYFELYFLETSKTRFWGYLGARVTKV